MVKKNALKFVIWKYLPTFAECYKCFYEGGPLVRAPHHTNVCKISRLFGAKPSLAFDVAASTLASFLISLRRIGNPALFILSYLFDKTHLKRGKALALQLFLSITVFVMQKFHFTCTRILCILDDFLRKQTNKQIRAIISRTYTMSSGIILKTA